MPNTIFAVLFGILALVALFLMARERGRGGVHRHTATGWIVLALAALIQAVNLLTDYSTLLSVLTTLGLLASLWLLTRDEHHASGHP